MIHEICNMSHIILFDVVDLIIKNEKSKQQQPRKTRTIMKYQLFNSFVFYSSSSGEIIFIRFKHFLCCCFVLQQQKQFLYMYYIKFNLKTWFKNKKKQKTTIWSIHLKREQTFDE